MVKKVSLVLLKRRFVGVEMFMYNNLHIRYSLHAMYSFFKVFPGLLSTNHTWTHAQDLKLVSSTGKLSSLSLEFNLVLPLKGSK